MPFVSPCRDLSQNQHIQHNIQCTFFFEKPISCVALPGDWHSLQSGPPLRRVQCQQQITRTGYWYTGSIVFILYEDKQDLQLIGTSLHDVLCFSDALLFPLHPYHVLAAHHLVTCLTHNSETLQIMRLQTLQEKLLMKEMRMITILPLPYKSSPLSPCYFPQDNTWCILSPHRCGDHLRSIQTPL